ncbi:MAG: hypothetical protein NZ821_07845, partial [Gloeomargarita sp. SKYB31]|nr:hypothetical protein [Gloeomargarita sp. SKYB31]
GMNIYPLSQKKSYIGQFFLGLSLFGSSGAAPYWFFQKAPNDTRKLLDYTHTTPTGKSANPG